MHPSLNHDACYRAVQSRDARFDGRFFTAVRSTGIFCRSICPARTPLQRNVSFYPSAAAAMAAGFRPCLRCRPELAPAARGALMNGAGLVANAVSRLLLPSADAKEPALATQLGVSERHLRRLFVAHVGAPPHAVVQARRILFAKQLIDETTLPMTEIAFAASFRSLRRFNEAMRIRYGVAPSALRSLRRLRSLHNLRYSPRTPRGANNLDGQPIALRLAYTPPYDWPALAGFLAGRAFPEVETIDGKSYRRVLRINEAVGIVRIAPSNGHDHLIVELAFPRLTELSELVARVKQVFDLDVHVPSVTMHLSRDAVLKKLLKRMPGLRVPGTWNPFELALRAILGQQVSVVAATTLAGRIVRAFGEPVEARDPLLTRLFPRPDTLARTDPSQLAALGIVGARARSIVGLAQALVADPLLFHRHRDLEHAVRELRRLPGIGEWTAQYIAMRALREPDAFPAADLGLIRAYSRFSGRAVTAKELLKIAEAWRPWRSYAAMLLWQSEKLVSGKPSGG